MCSVRLMGSCCDGSGWVCRPSHVTCPSSRDTIAGVLVATGVLVLVLVGVVAGGVVVGGEGVKVLVGVPTTPVTVLVTVGVLVGGPVGVLVGVRVGVLVSVTVHV